MNKLTLLVIILVLSGKGWSQSFSIEDAKAYAIENNLTSKNADQDVLNAHQRYIEIRGMGLPQVNIEGNFSHFLNIPVQVVDASFINPMAAPGETISFRAGTEYSASGSLKVGQLLFNGSYLIGLKAADLLTDLQATSSNLTKEEVAFNTIQSYELAAVAKENLQFVDSMVILTQELIDKQKNYLELGLMKQEDFDQLSYSLLTAKDAQLSAQLQYDNTINMLKMSMGYPMDQPIEITDNTERLLTKSALSTGGNIKENITYSILKQQVVLSELDVKNNKFANLPTLNAFFQHTYNAFRNEFNFFAAEPWFPQTLWGLQLNVPIFSGLTRKAKTSQAEIRLQKDRNSLEQMEQTLKFQEIQAKNNLSAAQNKYDLQGQNVVLARSIYDNSLTKEKIGEGNSILVTQKYNQLMAAQAQYLGSLIELFQAKLALDKLYNKILPTE